MPLAKSHLACRLCYRLLQELPKGKLKERRCQLEVLACAGLDLYEGEGYLPGQCGEVAPVETQGSLQEEGAEGDKGELPQLPGCSSLSPVHCSLLLPRHTSYTSYDV